MESGKAALACELWNYNEAGTKGVANIEPEKIEDESFEFQLGGLSDLSELYLENEPIDELNNLYTASLSVCEELSDDNGLARFYLKRI